MALYLFSGSWTLFLLCALLPMFGRVYVPTCSFARSHRAFAGAVVWRVFAAVLGSFTECCCRRYFWCHYIADTVAGASVGALCTLLLHAVVSSHTFGWLHVGVSTVVYVAYDRLYTKRNRKLDTLAAHKAAAL